MKRKNPQEVTCIEEETEGQTKSKRIKTKATEPEPLQAETANLNKKELDKG